MSKRDISGISYSKNDIIDTFERSRIKLNPMLTEEDHTKHYISFYDMKINGIIEAKHRYQVLIIILKVRNFILPT